MQDPKNSMDIHLQIQLPASMVPRSVQVSPFLYEKGERRRFSKGSRSDTMESRRRQLVPIVCLLVAFLWLSSAFRSMYRRHRASPAAETTALGVIRRAQAEFDVREAGAVEFDIRDFGAVGDGEVENTGAFERAVEAIETSGGGTLYVGRGVWLTAPFNLTSHMTLFLDEGAVILGVEDERKWPLMPPLPSYGFGREHDGPRYGSLVHGQHLKNVVITGRNGTIDGQGQVWWTKYEQQRLNYTRGPLVQFMWSEDIVISNITLRNSSFWTLHPYVCNNVTISNVTILTPVTKAPNTDGIDPDSCKNVVIENCYIHVGDDGIAIKSGWDQYGIKYGRPSTNIIIRNLVVRTVVSAAVSIGSEMSGGVSNVLVENLRAQDSRQALRIKTAPGRGGYVRNITYRNITIDNVRDGIVIETDYNQHADGGFDPGALPLIENITFSGIHGRDVRLAVNIHGSKEIPVKGVTIRDMSLKLHHNSDRGAEHAALDWSTRLRIIRGIVRGMAYLHEELTSTDVPHGNLKSGNILLNHELEPLVVDYGFTALVNPAQAANVLFAYKSPEALQHRHVCPKSDVYCLGIVVLEILTGKFPSQYLSNAKGGTDVVQWSVSAIAEGREAELLDPDITRTSAATEDSIGDMVRLLKVGVECTRAELEQRPTMNEVAVMVEEISASSTGDETEAAATTSRDGGGGGEEAIVAIGKVKSFKDAYEES